MKHAAAFTASPVAHSNARERKVQLWCRVEQAVYDAAHKLAVDKGVPITEMLRSAFGLYMSYRKPKR